MDKNSAVFLTETKAETPGKNPNIYTQFLLISCYLTQMWLTSPSFLSVIRALKSLFFQGADSPLLYQTHELCNTIKIAWLIANFLRDLGHEDVTEKVLTALNKKLVKVIIKFETTVLSLMYMNLFGRF